MNKLLISVSLVSILALSSTSVFADKHHKHNSGFEDTARVTHVEPIYTTVRVSTPQRECYQRPHNYRSNYRPEKSYTSTIAGGIIGGVLGNQFGKGRGKTAMTVAGTLLGGSVGRDANYQSRANRYNRYDDEERCHVSERYHQEERIDGYRVSYKYRGQTYTTKMNHEPGRRIPVEVSVRPIRDYY